MYTICSLFAICSFRGFCQFRPLRNHFWNEIGFATFAHGNGARSAPRLGIFNLKKLHEYLQHAAECRDMARTASPAHRQHLEQMAETWEQLAEARKRKLEKHAQSPEDDYPTTD